MKKDIETILNRLKKWEAKNEHADLTQMEEAIDAELAGMRNLLLEQMVKEVGEKKAASPLCPNCKQEMMKNGRKKRKLRAKNGGEITIVREQMRCHQCGMTLFPPR